MLSQWHEHINKTAELLLLSQKKPVCPILSVYKLKSM